MPTLFASDLHLSTERPTALALFKKFLQRASRDGAVLFLLGDLFEIWLGDDDETAPNPQIIAALREFTAAGATLYVMSGNRDFLLGHGFASRTGAVLLPDWHVVNFDDTPTLLTHGDLLCTKDVQYQAFRKYVRDPANQADFLARPLAERRAIAAQTRDGTRASMLEKDEFIMDVEQETVAHYMDKFQANRLIHGHTHRPARHAFSSSGRERERIVLGDWYEEGAMVVFVDSVLHHISVGDYVSA